MKKNKKIKIAFITYTVLWVVAIIGISVKLWSVLEEYQMNYVMASENANPDLVMDVVLTDYEPDVVLKIAEPNMTQVSEYENPEIIRQKVNSIVLGKTLSYRREERFTERKPIYEVLADDEVIGLVSLKQGTKSDTFGFRTCEVDEKTLNLDSISLCNYQITVPQEYDVLINGQKVDETYQVSERNVDSAMAKKAAELTGKQYCFITYAIEGFIDEPKVTVKKDDGEIQLSPDDNNVFACGILEDDSFKESLTDYILSAGKSYVLNTNQLEPFQEVSKYIRINSNAYTNVKSVQSGLSWAGKPDKLDIVDAKLYDMTKYGEDVFTVKTYYRMERLYREVTYDEEMTYEWLFVNQDGKWLIEDFSIVKE